MPDTQLTKLDRLKKWANVNRAYRMRQHFKAIKTEIYPRTAKEKKELAYFTRTFEEYYKKTTKLIHWRLVLYALLYSGAIVTILQQFPALEAVTTLFKFWDGIVATWFAVVFGLVIWITVKINLYIELMNESLTHLITLYNSSTRRDTDKFLRKLRKTL